MNISFLPLKENITYMLLVFTYNIVTYKGLAPLIIMGSGFDDWVYWNFFTITVNHTSSHNEFLLNDVSLTNHYEKSLTNLGLISATL
jgi:hypothetical protein